MKPKVLVLLATCNGEKYLRQQLDSIYAQEDVEVSIFATDDGSTDSTIAILEEYKKNHSLTIHYHGEPHEFTYNFIDAIFTNKNTSFDYYAFSDQDDVWMKEKLSSAIEMLKKNSKNVYSSNLTIVNENLDGEALMNDDSIQRCNKYNAVFENVATGCTIVFSKAFLDLLVRYYPKNIYLHDYWVYLLAIYTDNYIYDSRSFIKYRQHGCNQIGDSSKKGVKTYYKRFKASKGHQRALCEQLLEGYRDIIGEENASIVEVMAGYKKKFSYRWKLMFSRNYKKRKHNFFKVIKLLLNKY